MPKQAEVKRDGTINEFTISIQSILNTEHFDALKTLRINRSRQKNLAVCALGDSPVHQQLHSPSSLNIYKNISTKMYVGGSKSSESTRISL